jgi:outer membrane protein TolC
MMRSVAALVVSSVFTPITVDALQTVQEDSLPVVTLEETIRRATNLDPSYVAALGRMDSADWARRAAIMAFIVPSLEANTSFTRSSSEFFNLGTAELTDRIVQGQLQANLNLFDGGRKYFELGRTRAELDASAAGERQALYQTALDAESDYYDVLAAKELTVVATERVRRAREQLGVARARVVSGAAVQTDSLQLLLELDRARVDLLVQETRLRVARFQLARRVGSPGAVDAAPLTFESASELPLSEEDAVEEALAGGPDYRLAFSEEVREHPDVR